jgi:hypothetical protein
VKREGETAIEREQAESCIPIIQIKGNERGVKCRGDSGGLKSKRGGGKREMRRKEEKGGQ